MTCPHCQKELPEDYSGSYCLHCRNDLMVKSDAEKKGQSSSTDRALLWSIFWSVFVIAPVLGLFCAMAQAVAGAFFFLLMGAVIAGFTLARIFNKKLGLVIISGIALSVGILIVYAGVLFVGCLVVLAHG